jgi:hypothetical protein
LHELFVRWLDGDEAIRMGDLAELTRGNGVQTVAGIDERARSGSLVSPGRPVKVLRGFPLATMEALKARVRARCAVRLQADRTSSAGRALFCSPGKAKPVVAEQSCGQIRARDLEVAAGDLRSSSFVQYFDAVGRIAKLAPSVAELKSSGAGPRLRALLSNVSTTMPVKIQIQTIFDSVVAAVQRERHAKRVAADMIGQSGMACIANPASAASHTSAGKADVVNAAVVSHSSADSAHRRRLL